MPAPALNKVLLFGLVGAAGCLVGWPVGEGVLAAARSAAPAGGGRGPSLVSAAVPPAAVAPPPSAEFAERLARDKAKTGDVQISLLWYDTNDIDLHCVGPDGVEIFFGNPRSPSGGELDVDANAACNNLKAAPVENIYWPQGGAPSGRYQVFVNYFDRCGSGPAESRFKLTVQHEGKRQELEGTVSRNDRGKKLVYQFELRPQLEVYGPDGTVEMTPGAKLILPVAVRRTQARSPAAVTVEGLPAGVTAGPLSIPPNADKGEVELTAPAGTALAAAKPKLVAAADGLTAERELSFAVVAAPTAGSAVITAVTLGVWTALIAAGLTLALLAGQDYYLGKRPLQNAGRAALLGLGGAAAGFVSGTLGQGLYVLLYSAGVALVGFGVGWVLLGGLLGWGVGFFLPNLDAKKAAAAGAVGGLLGAAAFYAGSLVGEWAGRLAGVTILGFCIGLMVAVVEAAFRSAWLEVWHGPREMITVNLGPEPVRVGGDARQCTVWARGAAAVALRYWVRDGKAVCEDATTRQAAEVHNGERRKIGSVELVVRTGAGGPAPAAAPRPRPMPLPPPPAAPMSLDDDLPIAAEEPAARPAPPAPPRPAAPPPKPPIVDPYDDMPRPISPPPPKPPAPPKPAAPVAAKPPAPKPPTPAAPKPPAAPAGAKPADPDACPYCRNGTKHPGRPGARYCMIHDQTY